MSDHLPIFTRWRCLTHNCGSYNFNNLNRHETSTCDIISEQTVGVIKPKTFGGYNGDLSRKFLKDWNENLRLKQIEAHQLQKWTDYRTKQIKRQFVFKYPRKYDGRLKKMFNRQIN